MIHRALILAWIIVVATGVGAAAQTSSAATPVPSPPSDRQPVQPCERFQCEPRFRVQAASGVPPERTDPDSLIPVPDATERARLRDCGAVVTKYRPEPDRPVNSEYEAAYLDMCFHRLSELTIETADILRRSVVRLAGPNGEPCTAMLLTDRIGLTARHCFQGSDTRTGAKLASAHVEATTVHGFDTDGVPWRRVGLRILIDGGADATAPIDVVAFTLKESEQSFPPPPRIRLLDPADTARHVRARQALLLASFPYGYPDMRIDDLAACVILDVRVPFVVHYCQSLQGSSGAPLFIRLPGQPITVGGVHVGAAGTVSGQRVRGTNEAVLLSPNFINAMRAAGIAR